VGDKIMSSSDTKRSKILTEVLGQYNLAEAQIIELRDKGKKTVWQINKNGKKMVLKKMPTSVTRTEFIVEATEFLLNNNVRVPKIIKNNNQEKFVVAGSDAYILMNWIDGKQPDYQRNLEGILSSMALFHRGSRGFIPAGEANRRTHLGTWLKSYQQKKNYLLAYAEQANKEKGKDAFTELFLQHLKLAVQRIDQAIELLEKSDYQEWVKDVDKNGSLCHQDFTPKNLRLSSNGDITVFDLDSITVDLPARDLRKIFNKVLKKEGTGKERLIKRMVDSYQACNPLTSSQWEVVVADLLFPHLFFGIVDKYYRHRAPDWDFGKHLKTLKQAIRTEEHKETIGLPKLM
jgi:spore coat-associated protein S